MRVEGKWWELERFPVNHGLLQWKSSLMPDQDMRYKNEITCTSNIPQSELPLYKDLQFMGVSKRVPLLVLIIKAYWGTYSLSCSRSLRWSFLCFLDGRWCRSSRSWWWFRCCSCWWWFGCRFGCSFFCWFSRWTAIWLRFLVTFFHLRKMETSLYIHH